MRHQTVHHAAAALYLSACLQLLEVAWCCTAGVFVHSIATGEGEYWDIWSSFFGNINDQVSDWRIETPMQSSCSRRQL
jgi:hypothetical protein